MDNINDFWIEDGVLIKYKGSEKQVEIPDTVRAIADFAFRSCREIESISIPASVTSIGYFAVSDCPLLERLEVDKNNPKYYSRGNCIINSDRGAVAIGCQSSVIPEDGSVSAILDFAFAGCVSLESITIPASIKRIWDNAFLGCYNLEEVVIQTGVEYIGCHVFEGCEALESIEIPDTVAYVGDYAFLDCHSLRCFDARDTLSGFGIGIFSGCCEDLIIYTSENSPIEDYAKENGIKVKPI